MAVGRIERLRAAIDEVIRQHPNREESRCAFVHLYGVSQACALLALKRGLDTELCAAAGMLHDIWSYRTGHRANHAELGAPQAEEMLRECGGFTHEEIAAIRTAIHHHADKAGTHDEISEVLKDADVLQHYLYNTSESVDRYGQRITAKHGADWARRLSAILRELSLSEPPTDNQQPDVRINP